MPLLDNTVSERLLWPKRAPWPRRRARQLMQLFQACFSDVVYDMDLAVNLANGQAFIEGGLKRVRLYGGLVRHRQMGSAGLAVVLAHETGHHLGGPPHMEFYRWLSSEERATEWAINTGLPTIFGVVRARSISQVGLRELNALGMVA